LGLGNWIQFEWDIFKPINYWPFFVRICVSFDITSFDIIWHAFVLNVEIYYLVGNVYKTFNILAPLIRLAYVIAYMHDIQEILQNCCWVSYQLVKNKKIKLMHGKSNTLYK